jgi:hypothetical protein
MKSRNSLNQHLLGRIKAALAIALMLQLLFVNVALAASPRQQYYEDDSTVGIICLGTLVIAVPLALWGRSEIRKRAAAVGSYEKTVAVAHSSDTVVHYIKSNYDRSSRGGRDWAKKWLSQEPPTALLSTWYLRYWENCLLMILLGILPYVFLRWLILGGRTEKITVEVRPDNGGALVHLKSEGKVGYEEAEKLAGALAALA